MNKRIISIVTVLSLCLTLLSLPVAAASTDVAAIYDNGVVTVTGTGFTSGAGYTVRIVDRVNSGIKAMGQVTTDGSGSFSASVTTGVLGEPEACIAYVNNSNGKLAGSGNVMRQDSKTCIVTAIAGSNGSVTPQTQTVNAGGNAVFIVTPDQGYEVEAVSTGEYDEANNTLTVFNVQEDMVIQITFKPIKVASVSLNKTTAAIEVNGSVTLVATVMPENAKNKEVTWSSGNTSVATVANGVVTGVRAGTAVITVTTVDGGKTAACSVSVKKQDSDDKDRDKDKDKDDSDKTTPPLPPSGPDDQISGLTRPQLAIVSIDTGAVVVTQSGNTAAVTVREDAIMTAAKAAQQLAAATAAAPMVAIDLQLPENISQMTVQLPGAALAGLARSGVGLQINAGIASIQLSPEILGSLPSSGNVSLSIRRVDPEKEINILPEGMRPAGSGIDLELGLDGSSAKGSIIIEVSVGADVNRDLVGLYYLNESTGELIFVGGKVEGSILQGETTHNSKYFVIEYKKQYKDTTQNSWYSKYVDSMTAKYIMSGYPGDIFNGSAYITRAEFAAALAKALGLKPISYKDQYKDINAEAYYAEAVQSLYETGIMTGDGKARFMPEATITREEIFAIIGRVAGESSANIEILQKYTDAGELSAWAVDGAAKAVAGKIILGEGTRLNPGSRLSRYEAAAILYRLYNR